MQGVTQTVQMWQVFQVATQAKLQLFQITTGWLQLLADIFRIQHQTANDKGTTTNNNLPADARGSTTAEVTTYWSFKGKPRNHICLQQPLLTFRIILANTSCHHITWQAIHFCYEKTTVLIQFKPLLGSGTCGAIPPWQQNKHMKNIFTHTHNPTARWKICV